MRIPFINSDGALTRAFVEVCRALDARAGTPELPAASTRFQTAMLDNLPEAIEYINYQMPQLILINFSDGKFDGFELMRQIVADPWLNHGAILAVFRTSEALERINALENANIVHSLQHSELKQHLPKVLEEIWNNRQILFQRALQQEFLSDISGQFVLANDVSIVPFYANLIANYLYNMGFIESARKIGIGLSLTEMLINAIEHGNCGISAGEKRAHLEAGGTAAKLIESRCRNREIAGRRVHFHYDIRPARSVYTIRDQGEGFDWRARLGQQEVDVLSEQGRGIWLASQSVDQVTYNEAGNEVSLRVEHRQNMSNALPTLIGNSEIVEFEPEAVVFRQGEESSYLYYIAEGEFRVEVNGRQLATMTPGDLLIGEMSFLLEETRSASVIANTDGKLIKISKEAFVETIKSKPYYGIFLAKLIAQRLNRLSQRIIA